MKIVNLTQRTPEWHEWRSAGIGSSDISVVMGSSPYKTRLELYKEKLGEVSSQEISQTAQDLGKLAERTFRDYIKEVYGVDFLEACAAHEDNEKFIASFDGISFAKKLIIEIKFSGNEYVEKLSLDQKSIKPDHFHQIQWQLFVSGFDDCIYCVRSPNKKTVMVNIKRCNEIIALMKNEAEGFLSLVQNKIPPEITEEDSVEASGDIDSALKEIQSIKATISELEKTMKDRIKIIEENCRSNVFIKNQDGSVFSAKKIVKAGSINYSKIIKDKMPNIEKDELEKYRNEKTVYWAFKKGNKA